MTVLWSDVKTKMQGLPAVVQDVLWAAMIAMADDNHAPVDNLGDSAWEAAEHISQLLDEIVNERGAT